MAHIGQKPCLGHRGGLGTLPLPVDQRDGTRELDFGPDRLAGICIQSPAGLHQRDESRHNHKCRHDFDSAAGPVQGKGSWQQNGGQKRQIGRQTWRQAEGGH